MACRRDLIPGTEAHASRPSNRGLAFLTHPPIQPGEAERHAAVQPRRPAASSGRVVGPRHPCSSPGQQSPGQHQSRDPH